MSIFEVILRGHINEDLFCVPGTCLGFHPMESRVVLGISENRMEFYACADLDWLDEDGSDLIRQVEAAARPMRSRGLVTLEYTEDPKGDCGWLIRPAPELRGRVTDVFMATPGHCWVVTPLGLGPPDGRGWDPSTMDLSTETIHLGIPIAANRVEVIAEVRPSDEPEEVELLMESALGHVSGLDDEQWGELMERLLDCGEPLLLIEGAQLAVLVSDPGIAGAVVTNLDRKGVARVRPRVAYAKQICGDPRIPEVFALLFLVCRFDSRGARQTECLGQLERLVLRHRPLPLLRGLKALTVKPPFSFLAGMKDYQSKGMRFVVCGEALIDLLLGEQVFSAETRWSALYGGSPMNAALGFVRLGEDSYFLGRLGGDVFGYQIERYPQDNGVATDLAVRTRELTSVAVISLDAEDRIPYIFHFQNTLNLSWRVGEFPEFREDDWLHSRSIGTISGPGIRAILNFVCPAPASLSYDINVRPTVLPDRVEHFQRVEQLIAAAGAGGGTTKVNDRDIY